MVQSFSLQVINKTTVIPASCINIKPENCEPNHFTGSLGGWGSEVKTLATVGKGV